MSTNSNHNHNTRSKSNQVYNIEVFSSPTSSIPETPRTSSTSTNTIQNLNLNSKLTPETPRTPRVLPNIPSLKISTSTVTSSTTSTNSDDIIFRNIREAEFIERLESLERDLAEIRINNFNVATENSILKDKITNLEDKITNLEEHKEVIFTNLLTLEKEIDLLNQYGRRENIELSGIPMNIPQENLENLVIDILRLIGLRIESYDIVGCHRINKTSVIIRFVNRKHAIQSMKNKKKLNGCKRKFGFNVFMHENLCPAFKSIHDKCCNLMDQGQITKLWTYNGVINVKFTNEYSERPTKIYHEEDINYYFAEDERIFY